MNIAITRSTWKKILLIAIALVIAWGLLVATEEPVAAAHGGDNDFPAFSNLNWQITNGQLIITGNYVKGRNTKNNIGTTFALEIYRRGPHPVTGQVDGDGQTLINDTVTLNGYNYVNATSISLLDPALKGAQLDATKENRGTFRVTAHTVCNEPTTTWYLRVSDSSVTGNWAMVPVQGPKQGGGTLDFSSMTTPGMKAHPSPIDPSTPHQIKGIPDPGKVTLSFVGPGQVGGRRVDEVRIYVAKQGQSRPANAAVTYTNNGKGISGWIEYRDIAVTRDSAGNPLQTGQEYTFWLTAVTIDELGGNTVRESGAPSIVMAPGTHRAPTNPHLVPTATGGYVEVDAPSSASPQAPVVGYRVYGYNTLTNVVTTYLLPTPVTQPGVRTTIPLPNKASGQLMQQYLVAALLKDGTLYYAGASVACANAVVGTPKPPTTVNVTPDNGKIRITWSGADGNGYPITNYQVLAYPVEANGSLGTVKTTTTTGLSAEIAGLVNGKEYRVYVRAYNQVSASSQSWGPNSYPAKSVVPRTVPGAPTNVATTPGTRQVTVSWAPPANNGGNAVSGYEVYCNGALKKVAGVNDRSFAVTGLANDTSYTFTVRARNAAGLGAGADKAATTFTYPVAPTGLTVTPGVNMNTVRWVAPAITAGRHAPVKSYKLYIDGNPTPVTVASGTSYEHKGLANNQTVRYKVQAVSDVGDGAISGEVSGTTNNIPGRIAAVTATVTGSGNSVRLDWEPPNNGGDPIKGYRVICSDTAISGDEYITINVDGHYATVRNLARGVTYHFDVIAFNGAGPALETRQSNTVTTWTAPSVPLDLNSSIVGDGETPGRSVRVTWKAPTNTGGADVTAYKIYIDDATVPVQTVSVADFPQGTTAFETVVTGLGKRTQYTFRVTAVNVAGESDGATTPEVMTWIEPGEPQNVELTPADFGETLLLKWSAPASDGGGNILGYNVYLNGSNTPHNSNALVSPRPGVMTYPIGGLTNGETYHVRVAAVNEVGEGPRTLPISSIPVTVPDAAGITKADSGNKQAFISITPPQSDGGTPIINYKVYTRVAGQVEYTFNRDVLPTSLSDVAVRNLENGTRYQIMVRAENATGLGVQSAPQEVLVGLPLAPTNLKLKTGNATATLTFDAAMDNGTPIDHYEIYVNDPECNRPYMTTTTTEALIEGLYNGDDCRVIIKSVNIVGKSGPSESAFLTIGSPDAPVLNDLELLPGDKLRITWEAPNAYGSKLTEYIVLVHNGQTDRWTEYFVQSPTRELELPSLEQGVVYSVCVIARNLAGESGRSDTKEILLGAPNAPSISYIEEGNGSITVYLELPEENDYPIQYMMIYVDGVLANSRVELTDIYNPGMPYTPNGTIYSLTNGTIYKVQATAVSEMGEGAMSEPVYATPYTAASAPTKVVAKATGATAAKVTWEPPANDGGTAVSEYYIPDLPENAECVINGTEATISKLQKGTEYQFEVFAINKGGLGKGAKTNSFFTWQEPSVPQDFFVDPGNGTVKVSWKAPLSDGGTPLTGYRIYEDGILIKTVPATSTETIIYGRKPVEFLSYSVSAINGIVPPDNNESVQTEPIEVLIGAPTAPEIVSLVPGDQTFTLKWKKSDGNGAAIASYMLYVDDKRPKIISVNNLEEGNYTYTYDVSALPNGVPVEVRLLARSAIGDSPFSRTFTVTPGAAQAPELLDLQPRKQALAATWEKPVSDAYEITGYNLYVGDREAQRVDGGDSLMDIIPNLNGGETYAVEVSAVVTAEIEGESIEIEGHRSNRLTAMPYDVPLAPEILNIVPGNNEFTVTFTDAADQGNDIKHYLIYVNDEEVMQVDADQRSAVVTNMQNNKVLQVAVAAANDGGVGAKSEAMETRTGVPGMPEIVAVDSGDRELTLTYKAAAQNGAAILNYHIFIDDEEVMEAATVELTQTLSNLNDGQRYKITVQAENEIGFGKMSAPVYGTPGTAGTPVMSDAEPGDKSVLLSWRAPLQRGADIEAYNIYQDDEFIASTDKVTYAVSGLENGKEYSFQVAAVNWATEGPRSEAIKAIPYTRPGAPENVVATPRSEEEIDLTWDPPTDDGGRPIVGYALNIPDGAAYTIDGTTAHVYGLEKGLYYSLAVRAINSEGREGDHRVSNLIRTMTEPDPPSIRSIEPGNNALLIKWREPNFDGSTPIIGYNLYINYDYENDEDAFVLYNTEELLSAEELSYTVEGLENGNTYDFKVQAVNKIGPSLMSSNISGTPRGEYKVEKPGTPRDVTVTSGDGSLLVKWKAPTFDGNSPITGYKVYLNDNNMAGAGVPETELSLTGLENGRTYKVEVTALNASYESDRTALVEAVPKLPPPVTKPSVPKNLHYVVNKEMTTAKIMWEEPDDKGNAAIDGYNLYVNENTAPDNGDTLVPDLYYSMPVEYGITYNVKNAAVNSAGEGAATGYIRIKSNLNIDANGDDKPDLNIDLDGDGKPDLNIDLDGDGKPDLNIDTNGDGVPDLNIDLDGDGKPDVNIDSTGDGTIDDQPPGVPVVRTPSTPLNLRTVSNGTDTITFKWDAPADDGGAEIEAYILYIDGEEQTLDGTETSFVHTISEGELNEAHTYQVAAKNKKGVGPASETVIGKLSLNIDSDDDGEADTDLDLNGDGEIDPPEGSVPSAPYGLSYITDMSNQDTIAVQVNWNAPRYHGGNDLVINTYRAFVDDDETGVDTTSIETSYRFDATRETSYKVQIAAENDLGMGVKSSLLTVDTSLNIDLDGDGTPDLNIDLNGDGTPDLNIDLDGDGKPDLNIDTDGDGKPNLNIDLDGDGKPDLNIDVDGDGIPDLNIDVDGDGEPDVNIDTDGDGIPDKPNKPVVKPPVDPVGAPTITGTVSNGIDSIKVLWTPPAESDDITGYHVYLNDSDTPLNDTPIDTLDFMLENLGGNSGNTTYTFRVAAVRNDEVGDKSKPWSTKIGLNVDPTGEMDENNELDNVDSDGDGVADTVSKKVKITGTVKFDGNSKPAKVTLYDAYNFEVASMDVQKNQKYEFQVDSSQTGETYKIVQTKRNYTSFTVENIVVTDVDINLDEILSNPEYKNVGKELYGCNYEGTSSIINLDDYLIFVSYYGKVTPEYKVGEGDGPINLDDYVMFIGNYGKKSSTITLP